MLNQKALKIFGTMQDPDVRRLFGTSLKACRNRLGLSQEQLAERADLHRTYISDVERGARNPSLQSITKLAAALDISVSALFPQTGRLLLKAGPAGDGEAVRILLVEDDADDIVLTLRAFKMARFTNHIQVVTDGAEALDYVFGRGNFAKRDWSAGPQVILLDLNLPKVSGLEVLRRLKANRRTRKIPVVVLTGSQSSMDVAECRQLGAETYLIKPVTFQTLSQATPHVNFNWTLLKPLKTAAEVGRA